MLWNWKLTDEIELQMHFLLCVFVDQWVECALCMILKKKIGKIEKMKEKDCEWSRKKMCYLVRSIYCNLMNLYRRWFFLDSAKIQ